MPLDDDQTVTISSEDDVWVSAGTVVARFAAFVMTAALLLLLLLEHHQFVGLFDVVIFEAGRCAGAGSLIWNSATSSERPK